jgi:hypothetical protein
VAPRDRPHRPVSQRQQLGQADECVAIWLNEGIVASAWRSDSGILKTTGLHVQGSQSTRRLTVERGAKMSRFGALEVLVGGWSG